MKRGRKQLAEDIKKERYKEKLFHSKQLDFDAIELGGLLNKEIGETKQIFLKPQNLKFNHSKIRQVKIDPRNLNFLDQRNKPLQQNNIEEELDNEKQVITITSGDSVICVEDENNESQFLDSEIYESKTQPRFNQLPNYMQFEHQIQDESSISLSLIPLEKIQQFMSDDYSVQQQSNLISNSFDSLTPYIQQNNNELYTLLQQTFMHITRDQFLMILQKYGNDQNTIIQLLKTNPNSLKTILAKKMK